MNAFLPTDLPQIRRIKCCIVVIGTPYDYSGRFIEDLPDDNVDAFFAVDLQSAVSLIDQRLGQNADGNSLYMLFVSALDIANSPIHIRQRLSTIRYHERLRIIGGRTAARISAEILLPAVIDDVLPMPFDYRELLRNVRAALALEASQSMARFSSALLECLGDAVMITDHEDRIVWANLHFTTLTGYSLKEILGKRPHFMRASQNDPALLDAMWKSLKSKGSWRGEIWNRRKDGRVYAEWLSVSALSNNASGLEGYVSIFADITERKILEENLKRHAYHDVLTGLPNRMLLEDRFENAKAAALRQKTSVALLFLDLDGFKAANDQFGHAAGDQILIQVSERLRDSVRQSDTVARLGGDEFVCLLTDLHNLEEVEIVAEKVRKGIAQPYAIDGNQILVTCSIGKAIYQKDGGDFASLLACADQRMFAAKRASAGG